MYCKSRNIKISWRTCLNRMSKKKKNSQSTVRIPSFSLATGQILPENRLFQHYSSKTTSLYYLFVIHVHAYRKVLIILNLYCAWHIWKRLMEVRTQVKFIRYERTSFKKWLHDMKGECMSNDFFSLWQKIGKHLRENIINLLANLFCFFVCHFLRNSAEVQHPINIYVQPALNSSIGWMDYECTYASLHENFVWKCLMYLERNMNMK